METRSRKRAEATSSSSDATVAASSSVSTSRTKRRRLNPNSNPESVTTRSRITTNPTAANRMDPPPPPSSRSRRSRNSNQENPESSVSRNPDPERLLNLNFDSADDESEQIPSGILHQNLHTASSAIQGLLRKLGVDEFLPTGSRSGSGESNMSTRMKKILTGLRADGEEGKQVEALTQLCEILSIGTEESLGSFSVDAFVPVLVGLLNLESNADVMLLAARALTHLCDVLPSSCSAVVHYGAVPVFCARLLTIEYMDLAEQSLQALKKISQEHPTACLRAGALMAVLSYLDFFSTGVQRVALSTAANMCKKLPSDAADYVMEAVPLLTNLLNYHDSKVLDHASVCLTRIAESFASSPERLDALCNHGLISQAAALISISNTGQTSLASSTYAGLVRLLSTCASGSPLGAKTLLLLGISGILKDILSGSGLVANISVSPAFTKPPEQIYEMVNLADELLPPLPQGVISLPVSSNILVRGSATKKNPASTSEAQDSNGTDNEVSPREKLLQDQPELLQQFGLDLLPVLTQIYASSVNGPVRYKCLSALGKLMYFSSADMIQSLLGVTNLSSFLAGILAWKDPQVIIPALQIAEILMEKLPATFSKAFVREGVVHAVDSLICTQSLDSNVSQIASDKDNDTVPGNSSRSRRYRRRSAASNTDNNSLDEFKSSALASVEIPNVNANLRSSVSARAKAFKEKYFPSDDGASDAGLTEDIIHLKNLCAKLNISNDDLKTKAKGKSKMSLSHSFDISASIEEQLDGVVAEILAELTKGDGVSTFEFIGSGVVVALLNYLSCGTFGKDRVSEPSLSKLRNHAVRRYKSFISVTLPSVIREGSSTPMTILVQKLQNALSSLERFHVLLSNQPRSSSSGSARLSSGLGALAQPLKLRLCRAHGEKSLKDYSSNILLIDPLASLGAIEDFLWSRVQRSESGQKPLVAGNSDAGATASGAGAPSPCTSSPASNHRPSTRSRTHVTIGGAANKKDASEVSANSSKGKGKAVVKSNDEGKGPQTRNSARRRAAAAAAEKETKSAHGNSSSEDEEFDMSAVEIDEALMIDEDDISEDEDDDLEQVLRDDSLPICTPEKVHDVKLGDTAEDPALASASDSHAQPSASASRSAAKSSDPSEFRSGSPFGSRGAMSFAAAAMAGLASVSGRGIRGSRDRRGSGTDHHNKLIFTAGGKQLSKHLTVYQAVQRQLVHDEDDHDDRFNSSNLPNDGSRFWSDIFTINYQKADGQVDRVSQTTTLKSSKTGSSICSNDNRAQPVSLLDSILQGELPCDLEKTNPTYNILALLRVLEVLNQLAPRLRVQAVVDDFAEGKISDIDELYETGLKVPSEEFINSKLTPKLARQIQDALALCSGSLPSWCYQMTKACPFLFPFETRRQYFYSTAFGVSRALHRLQQQHSADNQSSASEREVRVGRLQRQKVRVSRNRILDSAAKVMEMYSSQKAVLEVEYFGEVGTGLGPTLEFYTLLSHDLQKVGLGLWRSSSTAEASAMQIDGEGKNVESRDYVHAPLGLFPRPWPPSADATDGSQLFKVIEYFRLLGRVMAKALQDGRLLDLPLSAPFYKLILGQELDLYDILSFDAEFGKILQEMQILVFRKKSLEAGSGSNERAIDDLRFRGVPIEDLCFDFTLPGHPEYILKETEENSLVNIDNLEEYVSLVVDATVKSGITRQMEAFRTGFNQVFDISSLQIFSPHELDYLLCGRRELWEPESLADHIKFDHGYTAKSPAIVNLLEIMGEFTPEQQHAFCQFVTGAPRLPPGGLAALNPKLTIVRKHSSTATNTAANAAGISDSADDDLPSVMTCANYLKLPPYSTKEIMYKKLLYAISEGQGSFDLS